MKEIKRFFITRHGDKESEVSKETYIKEERNAGFFPKSGNPNHVATGSFSNGRVSGRVHYERS